MACCALNAIGASWWRSYPWLITSWDQMGLGVDGDLYIVADGRGAFAAGRSLMRVQERAILVVAAHDIASECGDRNERAFDDGWDSAGFF